MRRKLGTRSSRATTPSSPCCSIISTARSRASAAAVFCVAPDAAYQHYLDHWNRRSGSATLERMLYADQKTYLVELLMKQDQMSMAASIESRVPFLDHTLVEFAAAIPDRLKIRGGVQKYVLKKAVHDLVPHAIVHRTKMGFPTPLRQWLHEPCAEPVYQALQSRDGLIATHFDRKQVAALIQRHRSGAEDATDRIWRLLNLQLWADVFLTGRARKSGMVWPREKRRAQQYEDPLGEIRFPTPHHQGRPYSHSRNAEALHRRHKVHLPRLRSGGDPEGPARAHEYSSFSYPIPHGFRREIARHLRRQLMKGLYDPPARGGGAVPLRRHAPQGGAAHARSPVRSRRLRFPLPCPERPILPRRYSSSTTWSP